MGWCCHNFDALLRMWLTEAIGPCWCVFSWWIWCVLIGAVWRLWKSMVCSEDVRWRFLASIISGGVARQCLIWTLNLKVRKVSKWFSLCHKLSQAITNHHHQSPKKSPSSIINSHPPDGVRRPYSKSIAPPRQRDTRSLTPLFLHCWRREMCLIGFKGFIF